jgi:hypothetical protein
MSDIEFGEPMGVSGAASKPELADDQLPIVALRVGDGTEFAGYRYELLMISGDTAVFVPEHFSRSQREMVRIEKAEGGFW